jgi:hypothetical protein
MKTLFTKVRWYYRAWEHTIHVGLETWSKVKWAKKLAEAKERWKLILCAIGQPRKTLPRTDPHLFGTLICLNEFAQHRAKVTLCGEETIFLRI